MECGSFGHTPKPCSVGGHLRIALWPIVGARHGVNLTIVLQLDIEGDQPDVPCSDLNYA